MILFLLEVTLKETYFHFFFWILYRTVHFILHVTSFFFRFSFICWKIYSKNVLLCRAVVVSIPFLSYLIPYKIIQYNKIFNSIQKLNFILKSMVFKHSVCVCIPWHVCRYQRKPCGKQFSPTVCIQRMKLRSSGQVTDWHLNSIFLRYLRWFKYFSMTGKKQWR